MSPRGSNNELGRFGEAQAAAWYLANGYELIEQNWRCPSEFGRGELDLIVGLDRLIVICEVKTRSTKRFGSGYEAVDWSKQRQIRKLATIWLHAVGRSERGYVELRFDVADVDAKGHVQIFEQAF